MTRTEALQMLDTTRRLALGDPALLEELEKALSPAEQSLLRMWLGESAKRWERDRSFTVRAKGSAV